jgi:hypothetical protein
MKWFEKIAASREPDFYIGPKENPHIMRWWVIPRNKVFNVYLHRFTRSDEMDANQRGRT